MKIHIYMEPEGLRRWNLATLRIRREARKAEARIPRESAMEYSREVVGAIMTQKHMGNYAKYSTRYEVWKAQYGKAHGFWQLMGDLVRAIKFFPVQGAGTKIEWMGGIPASAYDSGGKSWYGRGEKGSQKKIAMYGYVMEFGGRYGRAGYHPPRPIFRPVAADYAEGPWVRKGEIALNRISSVWR